MTNFLVHSYSTYLAEMTWLMLGLTIVCVIIILIIYIIITVPLAVRKLVSTQQED